MANVGRVQQAEALRSAAQKRRAEEDAEEDRIEEEARQQRLAEEEAARQAEEARLKVCITCRNRQSHDSPTCISKATAEHAAHTISAKCDHHSAATCVCTECVKLWRDIC